MNTIKFSPSLEERKETHNVEVYHIKESDLFGNLYQFYSNFPLTLYIREKLEKDYLDKLESVLLELKELKPAIIIVAPNLTSSIFPVLELLQKYHFMIRSFLTTGKMLLNEIKGKPILEHIYNYGVIHNLEISVDNLVDRDFDKIKIFCEVHGITIRLKKSMNTIFNLDDLLQIQVDYEDKGYSTIIFRDETSESLKVKEMTEQMSKNSKFKFVRILEGLFYHVTIFYYNDLLIKCYEDNLLQKRIVRELSLNEKGKISITYCDGTKEIKEEAEDE
ncbi:MAG: hypothetical protein HFH09_00700 [Bacilli bacterium]|nr:hypothetical protein [Bacilli bacterium]